MVLIVAGSSDEHATVVLRTLAKRGIESQLLDLARFPCEARLSIEYSLSPQLAFLTFHDGARLNLHECTSIWWRRPQPYVLHPAIVRDTHRNFAWNECHEAFAGLWQSLDVFWMNRPAKDEAAHRKVFQLRVAEQVGLPIPRTLISSDPARTREFVASLGRNRTVYKAFSATETEWRETRVLRDEEISLLEQVQHAPVIFQEYVDAIYDLRVTIVADRVFPAAIYSQETDYKVDCRMDIARARIEPAILPAAVEQQLRSLMQRLGVVYGAIDMRLTPDGRYVFLEINPAGQWLFIQERTGQPISEAVSEVLASHGQD